jgi:hypothetical protein
MNYSNPRTFAEFADWPTGKHRTTCTFRVEGKPGHGERVARVTLHPITGRPSKPKTTTYGVRAAIVDGDDGRTYVATVTQYGSIYVMQSNLDYSAESIFPTDPRFGALLAAIAALPRAAA